VRTGRRPATGSFPAIPPSLLIGENEAPDLGVARGVVGVGRCIVHGPAAAHGCAFRPTFERNTRMNLRRYLAAAATAASFAFAALPSQAITWGQPDGDAHPHVVALLFQQGTSLFSCTGTLLTPYVVLTAGHCTEEGGKANVATWVRNTSNIDLAFQTERPSYVSTLAWLDATWVRGTAVPHPKYDDYSQFPNNYDVGVVLLQQPISVPVYGALPTLGLFDFLKTSRGAVGERQAVVVGYGLQGRIPPFSSDEWRRYRGVSSIANLDAGYGAFGAQNFQFTNNPGKGTGPGGTCSGDSGGPAFWIDPVTRRETNLVIAVNSYSITPKCNGTDYQMRTDIADTLDFVTPHLSYRP
jgi:Trypsin